MTHFDVIIVGAGPAGSLLGYTLALKKINVLMIDKKKSTDRKVCGGGLTKRAVDLLPFDISEVVQNDSHTVHIHSHNRLIFQHTASTPVIRMVMREQFDSFLTQKAANKGVTVMDETQFKTMTGDTGSLNIETSKGMFKTKFLVGADGVHSKTAKALQLHTHTRKMIGLEAEVYIHHSDMFNRFANTTCFDFGVIPKGYGWIFPKREHLSIGIVSVSKKTKSMKQYLYHYLKEKKLAHHSTIQSLQGWMIPYASSINYLCANEKGLLVGDAAGLTDPITGEGLFYALKEAQIASQVIADKLLLGIGGTYRYNDAIEILRQDLIYALKLQKLLYAIPRLNYRLMRIYGNRLGKKYLDIITEKTTYEELYKQIFSLRGIKALFKLKT